MNICRIIGMLFVVFNRKRTRTEQITFDSGPFVAEMGDAIHVHNRSCLFETAMINVLVPFFQSFKSLRVIAAYVRSVDILAALEFGTRKIQNPSILFFRAFQNMNKWLHPFTCYSPILFVCQRYHENMGWIQ